MKSTAKVQINLHLLACVASIAFTCSQPGWLGAQPELFDIKPFHSQVEFSVPFMGLARVKGSFEDFSGAVLMDTKHPRNSSVAFVIQSESLHTGNVQRDKHLRSSDFFDVATFPTIEFVSERVEERKGDYLLHGKLTMHGTTRPVAIPFEVRHALRRDPGGIDYAGYDAQVKLNWREFGIAATNEHNSWFQPSRMLVSDSVTVTLSIEAEMRHPSRLSYAALDNGLRILADFGIRGLTEKLNEAKAKGPDSLARFSRPLTDIGNSLLERGDTVRALEVLRLNRDASPADAEAHASIAYAFFVTGRKREAQREYAEAIRLDRSLPHAVLMLRRLQE